MPYNDRKRKITKEDIDMFTINIEAVMDSKVAMPYFVKYLHDTKNGENANFLKDISEFREIRHEKTRKDKADYIIDMYVRAEAPHELNISNDMRSSIIENNNYRRNMFDALENHIVSSMKDHVFPMFLKSKLFMSLIDCSTLDLLYQIGTVNENTLLNYIDKLSNLNDEYVTLDDLKFIESQVSETTGNWELLGKGKNYKCLYSKDSYNIGDSSGLNFFKYYIDIDYDFEICLATFKEKQYRLMLDKNLVSLDNIAYLTPKNEKQLYTTITRDEYKIIYPFENREFIVSTSGIKKDNKIYIIMKTSNYESPYKTNAIRCPSFGAWVFENMGNNKTRYCQLHYVDFKIPIPNAILKMLLKKRAKQFYTKSRDIIGKFVSAQCVSIMDNNIDKTLFDNTNNPYVETF